MTDPESQRKDLTYFARVALVATVLAPSLVLPAFFFPFVTSRNLFFRLCVELAALVWILLWTRREQRSSSTHRDTIGVWFAVFIGAATVSALAGAAPWHSFFGDFERMGGVWAWFHLGLFYFLLRVFFDAATWNRFFIAAIAAGSCVLIFGSKLFGGGPSSVLFRGSLADGSVIGNPGLLAPYLLFLLGFSALFVLPGRHFVRAAAIVSAVAMLAGIVLSRNRSTELGLVVGVVLGALVWVATTTLSFRRRAVLTLCLLGLSGGVGYGALRILASDRGKVSTNEELQKWETFAKTGTDVSRTVQWRIAFLGFQDRPFLGYGPENHRIVVSRHVNPAVYEGGGTPQIFDRTHNAWLELLATMGLFGTVSMLGLWGATAATLLRGYRTNAFSRSELALWAGVLAAYATYLTFWFFDINSAMFWVATIAFLKTRVDGPLFAFGNPVPLNSRSAAFAGVGVIAVLLAAYLQGIVPLIAANNLRMAVGEGPIEDRLAQFFRVMDSSAPQTFHTLPAYDNYLVSLAPEYGSAARNRYRRAVLDLAFKRGEIEARRFIARDPLNDRSYAESGRLLLLERAFYHDSTYGVKAISALRTSTKMSPFRAENRILLVTAYLAVGDTIEAESQLDSTAFLVPAYGPTYFMRARLAMVRNQLDSALIHVRKASSMGYIGPAPLYMTLLDSLRGKRNFTGAAETERAYLSPFGPFQKWSKGTLPPEALYFAARLPLELLRVGSNDSAVSTARAFARSSPRFLPAVNAFVTDVALGRSSTWQRRTDLVSASLLPLQPAVAAEDGRRQ